MVSCQLKVSRNYLWIIPCLPNMMVTPLLAYCCISITLSLKATIPAMLKISKGFLTANLSSKTLDNLNISLVSKLPSRVKGIYVSQRHYALQLLFDIGFQCCKPASTPMEVNIKLSQDDGVVLKDPRLYRRLIGKLLYLTITQPDLFYSVNRLNQYLANPRSTHLQFFFKKFCSILKVQLARVLLFFFFNHSTQSIC